MSASLYLAGPEDMDRLLPMVTAFHAFEGIASTEAKRREAIAPLLDGSPHGAIWLIGPRRGPVGYIAITFGWSIEMGGLDGFIDELFIRENVRGRGMATEALTALMPYLAKAGLKALHLEVPRGATGARDVYEKQGFTSRDTYHLMTWLAKAAPEA